MPNAPLSTGSKLSQEERQRLADHALIDFAEEVESFMAKMDALKQQFVAIGAGDAPIELYGRMARMFGEYFIDRVPTTENDFLLLGMGRPLGKWRCHQAAHDLRAEVEAQLKEDGEGEPQDQRREYGMGGL